MWWALPEAQERMACWIEHSKAVQRALTVFLYAMAFSAVCFGITTLGYLFR
jgi:hypothetical protein